MKSVIFEDYSERMKRNAKLRKRLLTLINSYPRWEECDSIENTKYIYPSWEASIPLLAAVQEIGNEIGDQTMDYSKPIKSINPYTFSKAEYNVLQALGYTDKSIRLAMGKTKSEFNTIKKNRNLIISGRTRGKHNVKQK